MAPSVTPAEDGRPISQVVQVAREPQAQRRLTGASDHQIPHAEDIGRELSAPPDGPPLVVLQAPGVKGRAHRQQMVPGRCARWRQRPVPGAMKPGGKHPAEPVMQLCYGLLPRLHAFFHCIHEVTLKRVLPDDVGTIVNTSLSTPLPAFHPWLTGISVELPGEASVCRGGGAGTVAELSGAVPSLRGQVGVSLMRSICYTPLGFHPQLGKIATHDSVQAHQLVRRFRVLPGNAGSALCRL